MNDLFNDMFRSIFGFSRRDRFPEYGPGYPGHDSHTQDGFPGGGLPRDGFSGEGFPREGFPGNGQFFFFSPPFSGDEHSDHCEEHREHHDDPHIFRRPAEPFSSGLLDIFGEFRQLFEGFNLDDFGQMPRGNDGVFSIGPGSEDKEHPRDDMLKQPDTQIVPKRNPFSGGVFGRGDMNGNSRPNGKMDSDLDAEVNKGNLDALFGRSEPPSTHPGGVLQPSPTPRGFQAFKSVSVHTYRNADGKIEERRTIQDGRGNKKTTISRTLDGQKHSITTRTDHTGSENVIEDYTNLDHNEKDSFDSRWNSRRTKNGPHNDIIPPDAESRTIFKNLFGMSFPGFGGEDS